MALAAATGLAAIVGATLSASAADRINGEAFGDESFARSTDVAVINNTDEAMRLINFPSDGTCKSSGIFHTLPDVTLDARTADKVDATAYKVGSHGVMTGATECEVTYQGQTTVGSVLPRGDARSQSAHANLCVAA